MPQTKKSSRQAQTEMSRSQAELMDILWQKEKAAKKAA